MRPGEKYYIQDKVEKRGQRTDNITVYSGVFKNVRDTNVGRFYVFDDGELVVKPRYGDNVITNSYHQNFVFIKYVEKSPTAIDLANKKTMMEGMSEFHHVRKGDDYDTPPSISFFGEDYRNARDKFNQTYRRNGGSRRGRGRTHKKRH